MAVGGGREMGGRQRAGGAVSRSGCQLSAQARARGPGLCAPARVALTGIRHPASGIQPCIRRFSIVLVLLLAALSGGAASLVGDFDAANRLYDQGKFREAAEAYDALVKAGIGSPAVFFNLGNASFRSGQIGRAIVAYRIAESLAPRDPDVRANLQFAREQVAGPTAPPSRSRRWLLGWFSANEWAWLGAAGLWAAFLVLTAGQLRRESQRRLRGYAACAGFAAVLCFAAGWAVARPWTAGAMAVVVTREAPIHAGPLDEAQVTFSARDGAEFHILDAKDNWLQVTDGNKWVGWVRADQVVRLAAPPRWSRNS